MADYIILDKPTVADVIAYLQTLPQDAPLRLYDADTGYTITKVHIDRAADGFVWLFGDYAETVCGVE